MKFEALAEKLSSAHCLVLAAATVLALGACSGEKTEPDGSSARNDGSTAAGSAAEGEDASEHGGGEQGLANAGRPDRLEGHAHSEGLTIGPENEPPFLPEGYYDLPEIEKENLAKLKLLVDTFDTENGGLMRDERFEIRYPFTKAGKIVGLALFELTRPAYEVVSERLGLEPDELVVLRGAVTLDEYRLVTRKEWWDYGDVDGYTITFEPIQILFQRGIAQIAVTHEYAKLLMLQQAGDELPLWMLEGFASLAAEEGRILKNQVEVRTQVEDDLQPVMTPSEVETTLAEVFEMNACRLAYYNAFLMARKIQERYGWEHVALIFPELRETGSIEATAQNLFGMSYQELLDEVAVSPYDIEFSY